MTYTYGMKQRGFSIGCQPEEGFIKRLDDKHNKYYDLLVYNRLLTNEEVRNYGLDYIEDTDDIEELEFGKDEYLAIQKLGDSLENEMVENENGFLYFSVKPNRNEIYLEYNTPLYHGTLEFLANPKTGKYAIFENESYTEFNGQIKKKLEHLIQDFIQSDWKLEKEPKQENKATITPMIKQLESLFSKLNDKFFNNELESPVITIAPDTCRAYGWFTTWRAWKETGNEDSEGYYEITITSDYLNMNPEEIAGTLLHEMVHLHNQMNGIKDCSNSGHYHNKKFKEAAESHGLIAEKAPRSGYSDTKPTPETLQYFKGLSLKFPLYRPTPPKGSQVKKQSMRKYVCPNCGTIIRATKEVNVICGDCGAKFEEA